MEKLLRWVAGLFFGGLAAFCMAVLYNALVVYRGKPKPLGVIVFSITSVGGTLVVWRAGGLKAVLAQLLGTLAISVLGLGISVSEDA